MCRQLDVHFNDEPHNCDNPAKNYERMNFSSIMLDTHIGWSNSRFGPFLSFRNFTMLLNILNYVYHSFKVGTLIF